MDFYFKMTTPVNNVILNVPLVKNKLQTVLNVTSSTINKLMELILVKKLVPMVIMETTV